MDNPNSFWDFLLWSFWIFIWITAIIVWFRCVFDLFGDTTLSGWGKAGWVILLVFLPWLGALIYLIARGRSMAERQMAAAQQQQAATNAYIKDVAGASSAADQIASAKSLLDSGAITQSEFDGLKAKALRLSHSGAPWAGSSPPTGRRCAHGEHGRGRELPPRRGR